MRLLLVLGLAACGDNLLPEGPRILFVRGGSGTGGFVEGGTDDHLSSIEDTTTTELNRGYGELAQLLRDDGFELDEVVEGPASAPGPVDLSNIGRYAIVVFGSNNATYTSDDAALLADFIQAGGGALFSSDGNWGSFWDKAPTSDQTFLTQFGLVINQDGGGFVMPSAADFIDPSHPILSGVEAFTGEGTSPCTLTGDPNALADPVRLAPALAVIRRNTAPEGPIENPTPADASLSVVEYGAGRLACHFDRNTFFNRNGAGTDMTDASNRTYAHNLFAWLARRI